MMFCSFQCQQLPPIREFDAFPKTLPAYKARSSKGGAATLILLLTVAVLVWFELQEYLFGEPHHSFAVDKGVGHQLQINVDMTVAMPCHCEWNCTQKVGIVLMKANAQS
jgi:hypothetical protein